MKKRVQIKKETQEPTITQTATTRAVTRTYTMNFDEAIKAVYRKYGTDLPAFFRDAFREAAKKDERAKTAANAEVHPL
jgi:hypothetical protein